jgi:hypothetical protein
LKRDRDIISLPWTSAICHRHDRPGNEKGGGVLIASPPNIHCLKCNWAVPEKLECITVMLQNVYVTNIYRRPNLASKEFLQLVDGHLKRIPCDSASVIVGDFNEDLLSGIGTKIVHDFICSLGYEQIVQDPTTKNGTLIDHVYCKGVHYKYFINDVYFSDHDMICIGVKEIDAAEGN